MAYVNIYLIMLVFSVISSQNEVYIKKDRKVEGAALESSLTKTNKVCDSGNITSVTESTFDRSLTTSITGNNLMTTTTTSAETTHSVLPSSSKSSHGRPDFAPFAEHCIPTVVPFRSLPNETIEDLMSSILPVLIAAFPNHTMVVNVHQVGLASGLHPSITANGTSFPTANTTGPATSTAKPLSFTNFVGTLSNIVSIVTSCIQTWFQFRNLGELRRLFLPRLAPLDYLIHLRHLPVLAFIAQGRANPAVAVARPAPVARAR